MDDRHRPEHEMLRVMRPKYARHWLVGQALPPAKACEARPVSKRVRRPAS
jgi:hypothetical protein